MQFLVYIIIMIVSLVVSDLTRPVPKGPKKPGLEDFSFPTADATRKVPVIWGKPMVRGLNLTWWGALTTKKVTKKIKGVFFSKKQTIGYRFNVGMHMAFCVSNGDARLLKIEIGGEEAWTGSLLSGRGRINKESLFGGEESEGGINGYFDWCPGGIGQPQNDYLARYMSPRAPAYRSSARLVWRGGYVGMSKYIKEWAVQVQRLPNLLGSGYHDINGEANPAEMLFEILTHRIWGLGASNLQIETSTFQAAAKQLYDEKFGLSMIWDGAKELRAISDDILAHIDATMFVNVLTGKWELALHRALSQEQIDALPELTEDDFTLESFSRPTLDETTNEVNIFWTENGDTTKWPAKAQDLGLFQVHDKQFISTDISYLGITSYELAAKVATRDMAQLGYPLVKVSIKANRKAYGFKPASYFRFSYAPLGIKNMVCMVMGIGYGTLDDNVISIEAVQDVSSLGLALYSDGGGSGWVPPSRAPLPPTKYRMEFSPYWAMQVDDTVANKESALPILMVEAPSSTQMSYNVAYADPTTNGAFAQAEDSQPFTPTGVLAYDYLETVGADNSGTLIVKSLNGLAEITVASTTDVQNLGEGLIVIDNEWMAITSATARDDGSYMLTVQRGLCDTTIARHLAGATVWFLSEGLGRTPTQLANFPSGTYQARLISNAMAGTLPEENAPIAKVTTDGATVNVRPLWPYPVRALSVNGSKVPAVFANGDLAVAWRDRNRAGETYLFFQDQSQSVTGEAGFVKRAYLYNDSGALLASSGDLPVGTDAFTFPVTALPGGLPAAGYVQVENWRAGRGAGQRATLWFGRSVDYSSLADSAPQRLLDEATPNYFWRMSD